MMVTVVYWSWKANGSQIYGVYSESIEEVKSRIRAKGYDTRNLGFQRVKIDEKA